MRNVDGAETELDVEAIQARLQHAYATLFKLPKDNGQRMRVATYGYVSELSAVGESFGRIKLEATRLDIELMDEAISWPSLIGNLTTRRIVSARSMVHPVTERHVYPWNRLARGLGADARAVKRWHSEGLSTIKASLKQKGL